MAGLTAFSYQAAESPVHRAPALAKLLVFIGLSLSALLVPAILLAALAILLLALCLLARLSPLRLLAGILPLCGLLAAITLMTSLSFSPLHFDTGALPGALLYAARILFTFMLANLHFATSGRLETHRALEGLQEALKRSLLAGLDRPDGATQGEGTTQGDGTTRRPRASRPGGGLRRLQRHIRDANPALLISLTLSFLPRVFATWEDISRARLARTGKHHLKALSSAIPVFLERLITRARDSERAMLIRGRLPDDEGLGDGRGPD